MVIHIVWSKAEFLKKVPYWSVGYQGNGVKVKVKIKVTDKAKVEIPPII